MAWSISRKSKNRHAESWHGPHFNLFCNHNYWRVIFFGPEIKDPSGRVLLIDPQGTVVDQEVFNYDFLINLGTNFSTDQIQTRDLIN